MQSRVLYGESTLEGARPVLGRETQILRGREGTMPTKEVTAVDDVAETVFLLNVVFVAVNIYMDQMAIQYMHTIFNDQIGMTAT